MNMDALNQSNLDIVQKIKDINRDIISKKETIEDKKMIYNKTQKSMETIVDDVSKKCNGYSIEKWTSVKNDMVGLMKEMERIKMEINDLNGDVHSHSIVYDELKKQYDNNTELIEIIRKKQTECNEKLQENLRKINVSIALNQPVNVISSSINSSVNNFVLSIKSKKTQHEKHEELRKYTIDTLKNMAYSLDIQLQGRRLKDDIINAMIQSGKL